MNRNRIPRVKLLVAALAFLAAGPAVLVAQTEAFTLTKAIPADACLVVHTRGHDGQAFLNEQYARVWKAVEKARFDRELHRLLKKAAEGSGMDLAEFEATWQQMMDAIACVEWSTLCEREFAYAHKHGRMPSIYDGVCLLKPAPNKVKEDFEGLATILKTIAGLFPEDLALTEDDQGETVIHKLTFTSIPLPFTLTLARHEDVLFIGFGSAMVEQSLAMLRGEPGTTLASTPRFQAAFKSLPPGKDSIFFFDVAKQIDQVRSIFTSVKEMIQAAAGPVPADTQPAPPHPAIQWMGVLEKLLDTSDMFEYVAEVATTEGMKTTTRSITVLRDDAETRPCYTAVFGTGTLSDPLKYVPKDAKDVSVRAGIDWLALYKEIIRFFSQEVPGGEEQIAFWNALQEGWGVNVEQDLLGWLQGGFCTFTVPGPGRYSPAETVFMLKVRDEEKAREMINRALDAIGPHLAQQGGAISDAKIEGTEGFRSIVMPLLAMLGVKSPTVGVKDGWLFAASSPDIVATTLQVAAGDAESFAQNEQFKRDGIPPAENVIRLSFTDLRNMGKELGQALQMLPAMIRMVMSGSGQMAKQPGVDTALRVLAKVGQVLPEFNFLQSSCTQSTFDGNTIATQTIMTYCEPPAPPARPTTQPAPKEEEPATPPPGEPEG